MERDLGDRRRELLSGLSGRVLELGAGNGMNFGHYPEAVEEVVAIEPDPGSALDELGRVLKPQGELRFLEHVRSSSSRKAPVQDTLDRCGLWPAIAGGCHCARDTVAAMTSAGFAIEQIRDIDLGPAWMHTNPHVLGVARPS